MFRFLSPMDDGQSTHQQSKIVYAPHSKHLTFWSFLWPLHNRAKKLLGSIIFFEPIFSSYDFE